MIMVYKVNNKDVRETLHKHLYLFQNHISHFLEMVF